jgi:hypothetical protein
MNQLDARLLESNGWEIECESPFEIFHAETNSKATGMAARIVLEDIKRQEEETDIISTSHTIDKHNTCEICRSQLRISVLRPGRCVNSQCTNYYHKK